MKIFFFIGFLLAPAFSLFSGICGSKVSQRTHSFATIEDIRKEFHYCSSENVEQTIGKITQKNKEEQRLILKNLNEFYPFEYNNFSIFSDLTNFFSSKSFDDLKSLAFFSTVYWGDTSFFIKLLLEEYLSIPVDIRANILLCASEFFDGQMTAQYRADILREVHCLPTEKRGLLHTKAIAFYQKTQQSYVHGFLSFIADLPEDDVDWALNFFQLVHFSHDGFENFLKVLNNFKGQKEAKLLESFYPILEAKIDEETKVKVIEHLLSVSHDERIYIPLLISKEFLENADDINGDAYFRVVKFLQFFETDLGRREFFEYSKRFFRSHWTLENKEAVMSSLKKVPKQDREYVYRNMRFIYRDEQKFDYFAQLIENIIVLWKDRTEALLELASFSFEGLNFQRRLEFIISLAQLKQNESLHIKDYSHDDKLLQIQVINRLYDDANAPYSLIKPMVMLFRFSPILQQKAIDTVETLYSDDRCVFRKNSDAFSEYLKLAATITVDEFDQFREFLFEVVGDKPFLLNCVDVMKALYSVEKEKRSIFLAVTKDFGFSTEYEFKNEMQIFMKLIAKNNPKYFLTKVRTLFLDAMPRYSRLQILSVATKIDEDLIMYYVHKVQSEIDLFSRDVSFYSRIQCILRLKLEDDIPPIVQLGTNYEKGIDVHADGRDENTKKLLEKFLESQKDVRQNLFIAYFSRFLSYVDQLKDVEQKENIEKTIGLKPASGFGHFLSSSISSYGIIGMCPKEFMGRFWYFASTYSEENVSVKQIAKERENLKLSMMKALSNCVQDDKLICNPGKIQQLVVSMLQGRFGDISVDSVSFNVIDLQNQEKQVLDDWLWQNLGDISNTKKFKRGLNWYLRTGISQQINVEASFDYMHVRIQQIAFIKRQIPQKLFDSIDKMERERKLFFEAHPEYLSEAFLQKIIDREFQEMVV